jgi:hypothetical protein
MTGHLLGAAGGLESAICVLAIHHGVLPPTINYENPDPECDLDYVPNQARERKIRYALNNSFGFGGTNGSLIFARLDDGELARRHRVRSGHREPHQGRSRRQIARRERRQVDRFPLRRVRLEEAIRTKEAAGSGTVTVVNVGPERGKTGLRECLARGADDAVWVDSGDSRYLDALATAKAIAAVARGGSYEFLWFGQKGVGHDESLVGPMVAELLDLPHVGSVVKLEVSPGKVTAHREIEGAHEVVQSSLPAALTAQKG